jgi:hypothetical protein
MQPDIAAYHAEQTGDARAICDALAEALDRGLPGAERKVWHGAPVWFLAGNPVAGYAVRKVGVTLLFWSGRAFDEPALEPEGKFEAAQARYRSAAEIDPVALQRWLDKARTRQWDYKNIAKRRGVLVKLGDW